MKIKISEIRDKIRSKYLRRKVKYSILKNFYRRREETAILKEYIKKRILEGQTKRRPELQEKEAEGKEIEIMINYLKHI